MSELSTKTNDALLDRLADLERDLDFRGKLGDSIDAEFRRLHAVLGEIGRIHIELARRTATGWRPM
jgi:hypothetical protein